MRHRTEHGFTLVDLLVGLMLSMVVLGVAAAALQTANATEDFTAASSEALASLRAGSERLTKEVRQARRLYPDSTATRLHLWVDRNRDGRQEPAERITWTIESAAGVGRLGRSTDAAPAAVEPVATGIVTGSSSFTFAPVGSPSRAATVTVELVADTRPDDAEARRTVRATVRLRNVESS